jgi:hypothetical protein
LKITWPRHILSEKPFGHTHISCPIAWRVLEPHQQEVYVERKQNSRVFVLSVVKMAPDMTNERDII